MVGCFLPSEQSALFKALAVEAKSILDEDLNLANDYSLNLIRAINAGAGGFVSGPSYACALEAIAIIRSGARAIERKLTRVTITPPPIKSYVDPSRIAALQSINNSQWDFKRLTELCRELNSAAANRCHMTTAMLLRTIINHVPPVLGFTTFAEVANNYGGAKSQKSFKSSLQRLEGSLRSIADMQLHSPIRTREDVPTGVQVDFAAELDVLLGEVIRVSIAPSK